MHHAITVPLEGTHLYLTALYMAFVPSFSPALRFFPGATVQLAVRACAALHEQFELPSKAAVASLVAFETASE